MYTYSIFSIKESIANNYFYKTGIVYRFLKEYKEGPSYNYVQKQYNYVIEPLTLSLIASFLHSSNMDIKIEKRDKYLKVYWKDKSMTIYEDDRHLEVTCSSVEDIEEFFFPILRRSSLTFFVICNRLNDFGWLTVKNNQVLNKQLLYTY